MHHQVAIEEHSQQPLIRLEGVQKVFYTDEVETHALDNINIEIRRGAYLSIAGPSGCGKSTLLSMAQRRRRDPTYSR